MTNVSTKLRPNFKITSTFSVLCFTGAILVGNAACSQKHDVPTADDIESAASNDYTTVSDVQIQKCTLNKKNVLEQRFNKNMDEWKCHYTQIIHGKKGNLSDDAVGLLGRDEDGHWHFLGYDTSN